MSNYSLIRYPPCRCASHYRTSFDPPLRKWTFKGPFSQRCIKIPLIVWHESNGGVPNQEILWHFTLNFVFDLFERCSFTLATRESRLESKSFRNSRNTILNFSKLSEFAQSTRNHHRKLDFETFLCNLKLRFGELTRFDFSFCSVLR